MEPKISIIIPVYNVEKYLQTCIDSLLGQTMKELEIIFINDASPDNSLAILERNQKEHPDRIRVIDSKVNLRQGGARNLGIQAAKAPLIGFLDSDDFVRADMYQNLYNRMMKTDADVVFTKYACVPEDSTIESVKQMLLIPGVRWSEELVRLDNMELQKESMQVFIQAAVGTMWAGLWKKSLIVDNGIRFPEHLRYEDNYFSILLRPYVKKIALVPDIHIYYRQVQTSTVHQRNVQFHFDRITIEHMILDDVKKRGFFEEYYESWEYGYITRYAYNTIFVLVSQFNKVPYKAICEIKKDLKKEFPNWRKNRYLAAAGLRGTYRKIMLSLPAFLTVLIMKILRR